MTNSPELRLRRVLIGLSVLASLNLVTAASAAPTLERVVMVSRHGVRSPTRTVAVLSALTKRGWPDWPVKAGEMTEHGATDLRLMADFLRATYAEKGLLPKQGCPATGAVAVWADGLDHRTRQSGDIFAEGLAPGCHIESRHASDGALDPVYDASKAGACHIGLFATGAALVSAIRRPDGLLRPEDRHALETLQTIVAPDACKTGNGLCLLPTGASSATNAASLGLGATIAEGLYLQYAQGFPAPEIGWGKAADPKTIFAIMPVHEHGIDLLRRTPALAGKRGIVMARTILALLQAHATPEGAPGFPPETKLVMLAGHDSNLLYMAALMGLHWELPGQPTMTAPDTTLAFEVWRDTETGRRTIRIVVYAQTLEQLRDATPLGPNNRPDVVAVTPEACASAESGCDLTAFASDVERRLSSICGG